MSRPTTLRASLPALRRLTTRLRPYLHGEWRLLVGAAVAMLGEVAMRLLEPWPIQVILDDVLDPGGAGRGLPLVGQLGEGALLVVAVAAILAVAALRAGASYAGTIALALTGNRVLTRVRGDMFAHLQRLSLGYHARARGGDLVNRLVGDVGRLQDVAITAALPLVVNCLTVGGLVLVMFVVSWQLALALLAVLPFMSQLFVRRSARIRTAARQQRKREGAMAATAGETMSAVAVVQALGLEETFSRSFAGANRASLRDGVKAKRLAAGLERRVDVLVGVGTALVLWIGAREVQSGAMTTGELVVFLLYLRIAFKPMRDMAKYTGRIAAAAASGERVLDVLDSEIEIADRPGAVDAPPFEGAVRFEGVTLAYEAGGAHALRGIDLDVEAGSRVALVGPSGAGKSSLARLLLRLHDPTSGRVLVDGHDLRDVTLASLRAQVAIVLQESVLFHATIRENIAFGAPGATAEEIEAAARLANAHAFIAALPDGYETVLGERGDTLSGGQRQRIAIARAAVRRAPLLVLDEPWNGLDRENERAVRDALDRVAGGRTTVIVSHDLPAVRDADQIVWLEHGVVTERGTHDELMALDGRYAATYRVQERVDAALPEPA